MKMIAKNTKKIMHYLLRNFEMANINQVSKLAGISVGSAFKILKNLEKENIVLLKSMGNAKFYRINFESEEALKLCELLLIEEAKNLKGYAKLYAEELKNFKNAELIILFGSVLHEKKFNDVDVLFVVRRHKEAFDFCHNLSKIRAKPIIPLILKKDELINETKNKKEAIMNILKTGIVLKGGDVFLEVIKNVQF